MKIKNAISKIIDRYGGNKVVSEKTGIPVKTLESWKSGDRNPPKIKVDYIHTKCGAP